MSKEPNRNVYIGHRYVPLLIGEWDKKIDYEGLSIVTHQGNSYTSKKRVPVGIDILNKEFWVVTGNYNAQVEYYRQETERVSEKLDEKASHEELKTFKTQTNTSIDNFKKDTNKALNTHKNEVSKDISEVWQEIEQVGTTTFIRN